MNPFLDGVLKALGAKAVEAATKSSAASTPAKQESKTSSPGDLDALYLKACQYIHSDPSVVSATFCI